MKSVIFLSISSHDHPIYSTMREVTRKYFDKAKDQYNVRIFFVEFREMEEDIVLENDTIYVKGAEVLSNALIKTHKALQFINTHYNYDIIIRTNLSSFWNIHHLFEYIPQFAETNVATGIGLFGNQFITGTGIIMTKDVCTRVCEYTLHGEPEDVVFSNYLRQFIELQPLPENKWIQLYGSENKIPDDTTQVLYFRIKHINDDTTRHYDGFAFKTLAKKIYDIDIEDSI